jgi:GntR family transcriptional regulator / MocR family aminotransferase
MQLVLNLPKKSKLPVYILVAEALKECIKGGTLKPGDKLPSMRELAQQLNLARLTVNRAYEHLSSQSYIAVVQGSGTFVLDAPLTEISPLDTSIMHSAQTDHSSAEIQLSPWAKRVLMQDSLTLPVPDVSAELNYNAALLELLPINLWRKALAKSFDREDLSVLSYTQDPLGFRPLREAICQYLARARNLRCSADQIAIFCNTEAGTDKLARILLQPGDLVGVEEPGSPGVRTTFTTHACRLLPLSIDDQGMVVNELANSPDTPRLIYLTPSHQDPTGVALSLERREELLHWAKGKDCYIIEDDYDCEYYYGTRTLPALMSLDKNSRVIYRFNFWKSLFPLVRMGFLVLPKPLVPVMARAKMLTERDNSLLEQKTLAAFISLGYFERHVSRTRSLYEVRRAAVLQAIARHFNKKDINVSSTSAGTHVLANFSSSFSEEQILSAAAQSGVSLISTRKHYAVAPKRNEFIIAFTTLKEADTADVFAHFARLLKR